ncbi:hypothetical protein FI667_g11222, partial [Globisporangium splendens]
MEIALPPSLPLLRLEKADASHARAALQDRDVYGASSPRKTLTLPHFTSRNCADFQAPRRRHYHAHPERFEPQDVPVTANTTTLPKAIDKLQHAKFRIHACLERIEQTQSVFEQELQETAEMMDKLHTEQQWLATTYYNYFNFSAMQIQRLYRGYLGRRIFYQSMAVKAALRIQRSYRAMRKRRLERLRRFRLLCCKILRGMRGIRAKEELSHKELLNCVNHNMMIETQWRKAMGVGDTESTLIHALYRKKFMRKRIGAFFQRETAVATNLESETMADAHESGENFQDFENSNAYAIDMAALLVDANSEMVHPLDPFSAMSSANTRRGVPGNGAKQRGRVHEENLKREAARALLVEKQREVARLAELERQRLDEEQRQLRMAHAQALREDLERRGFIAIKELQSKKDEKQRKEEEARLRLEQAQQKIAAQVLSDETQQILKRKQRRSSRSNDLDTPRQ